MWTFILVVVVMLLVMGYLLATVARAAVAVDPTMTAAKVFWRLMKR